MGDRGEESIPPGQIKEDFTEEVTFKPSVQGPVGFCQVGMRKSQAKAQKHV